MTYKKKITVLLSVIAGLALVYMLTLVFDGERRGARSDAYAWLDPKQSGQIEKITLKSGGETTELLKKDNEWFVSYNGAEYPARQFRVGDLTGLLAARAAYPVQSSSPAAHSRLGVGDDGEGRITVSGASGLVLLDLLLGQSGASGRNIYLRKQGSNEVRSGENKFSAYVNGSRNSWYNLRLFPESENGKLDAGGVQRLTVYHAEDGGAAAGPAEPVVLTRSGKTWAVTGLDVENPDIGKIDSYVTMVLNTEGDDFASDIDPGDPRFGDSRISLELGNGTIKTARFSPPDDTGRRTAIVSGSNRVYALPAWAASRLFDTAFEKD